MQLRKTTDAELLEARENVTNAINDALTSAINGNHETGSPVVSSVNVMVFNDGNVTTRISGLVNKVTLYGALVEAILSLHEMDCAQLVATLNAQHSAMVEKYTTPVRSDN